MSDGDFVNVTDDDVFIDSIVIVDGRVLQIKDDMMRSIGIHNPIIWTSSRNNLYGRDVRAIDSY